MRMSLKKASLFAVPALLFASSPAYAQSAAHSGALEESAEAVGAGLEAGVKTSSAVAALPIAAVGAASATVGAIAESAGEMTTAVGAETMEAGVAALKYADEPLTVGDEIVLRPMPEPNVPYDAQTHR